MECKGTCSHKPPHSHIPFTQSSLHLHGAAAIGGPACMFTPSHAKICSNTMTTHMHKLLCSYARAEIVKLTMLAQSFKAISQKLNSILFAMCKQLCYMAYLLLKMHNCSLQQIFILKYLAVSTKLY